MNPSDHATAEGVRTEDELVRRRLVRARDVLAVGGHLAEVRDGQVAGDLAPLFALKSSNFSPGIRLEVGP